MRPEEETCWSMIQGAAGGRAEDRERFARLYEPIVRAYLGARWRGSPRIQELDDAVQEVFLDCLREDGALKRYDPGKGPAFRAFLRGVVRNVALRAEQRPVRSKERQASSQRSSSDEPAPDESLGAVFDRAWARARLREAAAQQRREAASKGEAGLERIQLLRMRFEEGLPIREIAERMNTDSARLHHVYATARKEFRRCLEAVVHYHHPGVTPEQADLECRRLLELTG